MSHTTHNHPNGGDNHKDHGHGGHGDDHHFEPKVTKDKKYSKGHTMVSLLLFAVAILLICLAIYCIAKIFILRDILSVFWSGVIAIAIVVITIFIIAKTFLAISERKKSNENPKSDEEAAKEKEDRSFRIFVWFTLWTARFAFVLFWYSCYKQSIAGLFIFLLVGIVFWYFRLVNDQYAHAVQVIRKVKTGDGTDTHVSPGDTSPGQEAGINAHEESENQRH